MTNKILTNEQQEYIKENYGKIKASIMAKQFDISINYIYRYAAKNKLQKPLNPIFEITDFQEQIILGGILGDGSFKKNGSNYYYRECHAMPEAGYLQWKYDALFNMTTQKIYDIPSRKLTQNAQVGFQTRNSPSFSQYALMSIDDVILKIEELGLMIWLLDDGWIRKNSKVRSYAVSAAMFTDEQIESMINKMKEYNLMAHRGKRKELFLS